MISDKKMRPCLEERVRFLRALTALGLASPWQFHTRISFGPEVKGVYSEYSKLLSIKIGSVARVVRLERPEVAP